MRKKKDDEIKRVIQDKVQWETNWQYILLEAENNVFDHQRIALCMHRLNVIETFLMSHKKEVSKWS